MGRRGRRRGCLRQRHAAAAKVARDETVNGLGQRERCSAVAAMGSLAA